MQRVRGGSPEPVGPGSKLPKPIKMTQLMERELVRPEELVEGLIHMSAKTLFIGGSKAFKTWTFIDLAVSIATGTKWWGHECAQGKVLYINFEIHDVFFRDRFMQVCEAKGVDPMMATENVDYLGLRGFAGDMAKLIEKLVQWARENGYVAILIDPIYKGLGSRDENSASDMADLMNTLDKISQQTGCAIVFDHHFSKGNQSAKDMIDRGAGSGVFGRDPDSIITMTPHTVDDAFVIEFRLRNFPPQQKYVVVRAHPLMRRDDSLNPDDLRSNATSGRPVEYGDAEILEHLRDGMSRAQWRDAVRAAIEDISAASVYRRIAEMLNDGIVIEENRRFRRAT